MGARTQIGNQRSESEDALAVQRDHDAIARLADDLLPALIAKLAASGLGEIEVRQGGWKARLRMPAKAEEPKASAKAAESHAGHGRSVAHRSDERHLRPEAEPAEDTGKVAAKSPAVGIYQPRKDLAGGMRVRSGDKIGTGNVLGVNQDVVSPVEGIIGSSLAEAGEAG